MLIRVESEWHVISLQDEDIWRHWKIEKNLISVDGEALDYIYEAPESYSESKTNWPLITVGIGLGGVVVVLLILGINPKKIKFKKNA